jgi:hypothetical protein
MYKICLAVLILMFLFTGTTTFAQSPENESAIAQIQSFFPELSAEDALYVYQKMSFEGGDTSSQSAVAAAVGERQTEKSERDSIYLTRIEAVRLEEVGPQTYKATLNLYNEGFAQSGIKYRLSLRPIDTDLTNQTSVYEVTYNEVLSLAAGERISRELDFVVPNYVHGEFAVVAELGGEHGIVHAIRLAEESVVISQPASAQAVVQIESCYLKVVGEDEQFNLVQGVDVSPAEQIELVCPVVNKGDSDLSLLPAFTTYLRNTWGSEVTHEANAESREIVLTASSTSIVSILLPKATMPQAYDVVVSLKNGAELITTPVVVHYVIQGESATIHNVTPNASTYRAGEVAEVAFAWSGSADNFAGARSTSSLSEGGQLVAEIALRSLSGGMCADVVLHELPLATHGLENITIPITADCENVVAVVSIQNSAGDILVEKTYSFREPVLEDTAVPVEEDEGGNLSAYLLAGIALAAFVVVCIMAVVLNRRNGSVIAPVFLILAGSFGVSLVAFAGTFSVFYNIWNVQDQGWSGHSITVTFTGPSGTYSNSQQVRFTSSLSNISCANIPIRSRINVQVFNSSNNLVNSAVRTNTMGYTSQWSASTFANGNYRGVMTWTDTGCQTYTGNAAVYPADRYKEHQCDRNPTRSETFYFTIANPPTGTLSGDNCVIGDGAATCTSKINWSITNATNPNLRNLTHNHVYSWSATGYSFQTLWYGSNQIAVRNGNTNLNTITLSATCVGGTNWNGSICASTPPPANPPTSITAVCSTPGNPVAISWPAVTGATHYALRIDYPSDPAPHLVQNDNYVGTSYSAFVPTLGTNYSAWVHACNAGGCSAGSVATTFACYNPPTISLSATPNPVGPGNTSNLTWSVSNATNCTASSVPNNWSGSKSSTGGSASVPAGSYTLSCTGPGGTSNQTLVINTPSATISATGCTISTGNTGCSSNVNWTSSYFLGTAAIDQGGAVFSSAASSLGTVRTVTPDNRTFTIEDGGSTYFRSVTASVACQANSAWVSALSMCVPLPTISVISDHTIVRSGNTAPITITIDAAYPLNCTITGGADETFVHTGTPSSVTYERHTRQLRSAQIVTVSCVSPTSPELFGEAETRIEVVPTFQEI